jgi:spore coat polysaccharide biosynthesis protein SpsF (cytidylyltransferase family)
VQSGQNIVAIIQARRGSSRLPDKIFRSVCGIPLVDLVCKRVSAASLVTKSVVATTTDPLDDALAAHLEASGIAVFRGASEDVLKRFHDAAVYFDADIVVRITADDPFKDPHIVDRVINPLVVDHCVDYASNTLTPSFPEGADVEVIRRSALVRAHIEARLESDREHVTPYIWRNRDDFEVVEIVSQQDYSRWRWTIDYEDDLTFANALFAKVNGRWDAPYDELVAACAQNPELVQINSGIVRNEGYIKSRESEA